MLNQSHFTCSSCSIPHELFGSSASFTKVAEEMDLPVLGKYFSSPLSTQPECLILLLFWIDTGKLPLVPAISSGGDSGKPVMVQDSPESGEVRDVMKSVAESVWKFVGGK